MTMKTTKKYTTLEPRLNAKAVITLSRREAVAPYPLLADDDHVVVVVVVGRREDVASQPTETAAEYAERMRSTKMGKKKAYKRYLKDALDTVNDEWSNEYRKAKRRTQRRLTWKDEAEDDDDDDGTAEFDWGACRYHGGDDGDDDDSVDSREGMTYRENRRKLKKLIVMVEDSVALPYRPDGSKLPLNYFYDDDDDDEDFDEWIDEGEDDTDDGELRMGFKTKKRFLEFLHDALNDNLECTFTSFLAKLERKKRKKKLRMSRATLEQLFNRLGDNVESTVPIESPVGSSVPSSGIVAEGVLRQPKYTRIIPIDSQRCTNDKMWEIFFGVVERYMLANTNVYKTGMGNASFYLSKWRTLETLECSKAAAFDILHKDAEWPKRFVERMFDRFDKELATMWAIIPYVPPVDIVPSVVLPVVVADATIPLDSVAVSVPPVDVNVDVTEAICSCDCECLCVPVIFDDAICLNVATLTALEEGDVNVLFRDVKVLTASEVAELDDDVYGSVACFDECSRVVRRSARLARRRTCN